MKVLLLCASHNDLGVIRSLRKLGCEILVIGNIPGLIGEKYADEYIQMDYSNKEKVLQLAQKRKIEAICQCCNDFGVYTAAYVAEHLGLPGYDSYENTLTLHNKDRFKKFSKDNGIITPESVMFCDIGSALDWIKKAKMPLIVKPVDSSAGKGIHRIDSVYEAKKAVEEAFANSRERRIVVESYIEGTQHGFCTFLHNRKVVAYCSNNEYSFLNPYRVEIDTYPADNYEQVHSILIEQVERIAEVLGLKDGIFHLQYIFSEGVAYIIEVMRRVLGNMYSVPASLLNGFDWDYWETRAKCGLSCDEIPKHVKQEGFYAYKTILARENGCIETIKFSSVYEKYLIGKCILKKRGDEIRNFQTEPIGFMFFVFSSKEEMKNVLIEDYDDSIVEMRKEY